LRQVCAQCAFACWGYDIYCEAKIAISNRLAALGAFSWAYNMGKHRAFMHLSLSLFYPPELQCFAHLMHVVSTVLLLALQRAADL
jgi:hypothetical protein